VYSWQVGIVNSFWANILLDVLSLDLVCIICLTIILQRRESGLQSDLSGIMTLVRLMVDSDDLLVSRLDNNYSFANLKTIFSKLDKKVSSDRDAAATGP